MEVFLNGSGRVGYFSSMLQAPPSRLTRGQCLQLPKKERFRKFRRMQLTMASGPNNHRSLRRFSWLIFHRAIRRGMEKFLTETAEMVQKEAGIYCTELVAELTNHAQDAFNMLKAKLEIFRSEVLLGFASWNRRQNWKDFKKWETKRVGFLILYVFIVLLCSQRVFFALKPRLDKLQERHLIEDVVPELIQEPSYGSFRKSREGAWKKKILNALKVIRLDQDSERAFILDSALTDWVASHDNANHDMQELSDQDSIISAASIRESESLINGLHSSDEFLSKRSTIYEIKSHNEKFAADSGTENLKKTIAGEVEEQGLYMKGSGVFLVSKRWWLYRPKLPYIYFFQRLKNMEVDRIVMTEDAKKLHVTMRDGFPKEFTVNIPLDPCLFQLISRNGTEIDILQKSKFSYFFRMMLCLLPGVVILWLIKRTMVWVSLNSDYYSAREVTRLRDYMDRDDLTLPTKEIGEKKSMHKRVVMGGDVWDLVDELMIYMRDPMQFYSREVKFVRGVLLYGPPGTGKTLFARTLAKESGVPLVSASGADFTGSESCGITALLEIFSVARRNAPCFLFVDEIDAVAGRHVKDDPQRNAIFTALIEQLDGEINETGVDRYSLDQAVIFICATNRPDDLDPELLFPGRIDRRVCFGLPAPKHLSLIFRVHSSSISLSDDVDFQKLLCRVVGYSGADIRNLVNEAAIMSVRLLRERERERESEEAGERDNWSQVRKGRSKVCQEDIIDVLDKQLLEGMGVLLTEEEQEKCNRNIPVEKRRLLAVHEAGHIVLAHLFPRFDFHTFSQLFPEGKETAISVFQPPQEMRDLENITFDYVKMQMVVAHGGRCAELIVFGQDVTDGGNDDLEKITKLAREMVISPLNSRLGLASMFNRVNVKYPSATSQAFGKDVIKYMWDDPHIIQENMSVGLAELFTRELTRFIKETEDLAMDGLKKNRHILDVIATELVEKSKIAGLDAHERIRDLFPVMFDDFMPPVEFDPKKLELPKELPPLSPHPHYQPVEVYPAPLHRC